MSGIPLRTGRGHPCQITRGLSTVLYDARMKRTLLLLAAAALAGCAGAILESATLQHSRDDFEGITKDRMAGNVLTCGETGLGANHIGLELQRSTLKDGKRLYHLIVRYTGDGWLFIQDGESLIFLVDGNRVAFTGDGSRARRDVVYGGIVSEEAWYAATPEQLRTLAAGREVRVKVSGRTAYVERCFAQKNFDNLRDFVRDLLI